MGFRTARPPFRKIIESLLRTRSLSPWDWSGPGAYAGNCLLQNSLKAGSPLYNFTTKAGVSAWKLTLLEIIPSGTKIPTPGIGCIGDRLETERTSGWWLWLSGVGEMIWRLIDCKSYWLCPWSSTPQALVLAWWGRVKAWCLIVIGETANWRYNVAKDRTDVPWFHRLPCFT